jgi:hypothetical protein
MYTPASPLVNLSTAVPTALGASQRRSLEHPPGYSQNPYASDMSAGQRIALEQGLGGEEGMWDMTKKWARTAVEMASEAESAIWRRIGGG